MICQCLADQLFAIDLLATEKSRYFAQPRPIIVNYYTVEQGKNPDIKHGNKLTVLNDQNFDLFTSLIVEK